MEMGPHEAAVKFGLETKVAQDSAGVRQGTVESSLYVGTEHELHFNQLFSGYWGLKADVTSGEFDWATGLKMNFDEFLRLY
jgi:hypothetical protein